jgi:hypothetical protein
LAPEVNRVAQRCGAVVTCLDQWCTAARLGLTEQKPDGVARVKGELRVDASAYFTKLYRRGQTEAHAIRLESGASLV